MQVFDKEWFDKHQRILLKFINTSIGRSIIGICLDKHKPIIDIYPEGYGYIDSIDINKKIANVVTKIFFTKYIAGSFHKNLYWVWKAMHTIDSVWLDHQKLIPDFGFATFTNKFDEYSTWRKCHYQTSVANPGTTWNVLVGGSGNWLSEAANIGGLINSIALSIQPSSQTTNYWYHLTRAALHVNTSVLNNKYKKITGYNFYCGGITYNDPANPDHITSAYRYIQIVDPAIPNIGLPYVGDYQGFTSTSFGTIDCTTTTGKTVTLNPVFGSYLSKTGYTQLGFRLKNDVDNVAPNWIGPIGSSYGVTLGFGDFTDTDHFDTWSSALNIFSESKIQININDSWRHVSDIQINIGDSWKSIRDFNINIGDVWKIIL